MSGYGVLWTRKLLGISRSADNLLVQNAVWGRGAALLHPGPIASHGEALVDTERITTTRTARRAHPPTWLDSDKRGRFGSSLNGSLVPPSILQWKKHVRARPGPDPEGVRLGDLLAPRADPDRAQTGRPGPPRRGFRLAAGPGEDCQ